MFENLEVVRLATAMARHASARHLLVAENIANADTPGYQARDLAAFDPSSPDGFRSQATRPGHMAGTGPSDTRWREMDLTATTSPNGNTVSLEDQMVRAAEIRSRHTMALTLYRKSLDLMRLGLGRVR